MQLNKKKHKKRVNEDPKCDKKEINLRKSILKNLRNSPTAELKKRLKNTGSWPNALERQFSDNFSVVGAPSSNPARGRFFLNKKKIVFRSWMAD